MMLATLRAEFKKLFTVRSTYGWILLALVIIGIYSFYGEGFKDASNLLHNTKDIGHGLRTGSANIFIASTIEQIGHFVSLFGGIIALLLIAHEYRYNTITYTITASNSRTKVLAAKILAVLGFVFVYSVLATLYGIGMIYLGLHFSHNMLPHQDISYITYLAKTLYHAEGYALAGLLFGLLIRNQVGSFAALILIPSTVEGLLSLIFRHHSVYLPFMALDQVIQSPSLTPPNVNESSTGYLSAPRGALVYLAYLVVAWIVGWYLFLKRDAT